MNEGDSMSFQDLVDTIPDLVDYLYNDTRGPHSRAHATKTPVPPTYTNWIDEQRGSRETAVLLDQSHHMPALIVRGPDAKKLLSYIGVNNFDNLDPTRGKQFVGCDSTGYVIGESLLYDLGDGSFEAISGMPLLNWIEYNASTGDWDVETERDNNTSDNPGMRRKFRFGIDGPLAVDVVDKAVDGDVPELPYFRIADAIIAGVPVRVLRHGVHVGLGFEVSGPYEEHDRVRDALLAAGEEFGLVRAGNLTYFSAMPEAQWLAYQLPPIYRSEEFRPYREWLPADTWEAKFQTGGSWKPQEVEGYYMNLYDFGYGRLAHMGHDFIGRDALINMRDEPHLEKVSLCWNVDDILRINRSMFEEGLPYKQVALPIADYSGFMQRDRVTNSAGEFAGVSTFAGYTSNLKQLVSVGLVRPGAVSIGDEVSILWGEPDGGSRKPVVERHRQIEVRATVAPPSGVPTADARKIQRPRRLLGV